MSPLARDVLTRVSTRMPYRMKVPHQGFAEERLQSMSYGPLGEQPKRIVFTECQYHANALKTNVRECLEDRLTRTFEKSVFE